MWFHSGAEFKSYTQSTTEDSSAWVLGTDKQATIEDAIVAFNATRWPVNASAI